MSVGLRKMAWVHAILEDFRCNVYEDLAITAISELNGMYGCKALVIQFSCV